MKHIKTRLFSAAAACLFAAQTSTAVFAEGGVSGIPVSDTQVGVGTGQVNVIISPALYLQSSVDFTAELTGNGSQTLTLDTDKDGEVCFTDLSAGDYTLKVSADGFADYVQSVSVEHQAVTVRLMTDFAEGIDYENGSHPGTLLIGDVNNDGVIDGNDKQQLTDAVDSGTIGGVTDLNGDGSIDLADLEYLAKGYETDGTFATSELIIPSSVIIPSAGEGTVAEGELQDLLVRDGAVRLSVSGGGNISDQNPVALQFDITKQNEAALADGIVIKTSEENPVAKAEVNIDYIDGNGTEDTLTVPIEEGVHHLLKSEEVTADMDQYGNIRINLGSKIAVKRVTFIIYGMTKDSSLAEISYVEFVNGMESRIPEPSADIPENLEAKSGDKSFVLTWDRCVNITGYEVMITQGEISEIKRVTGCSLSVSSLNNKKLVNGNDYTVKVRSVNGSWKSGWSGEITVTPKASSKPDRPDGLTAAGAYRSIMLSWKAAEDAEWYNVYFKLRSEEEYHKIENVMGTSYTVTGLEDKTEYVAYVTAANEHGESAPSLTASAATTDLDPPVMPKYHLINTGEYGERGQHIISASQNYGTMVGSAVEENERTAWGTVDHDPYSFYQRATWDDGGFNNLNRHGLFYEFDEEYTIQTLALHESTPISPDLFYTKINYWDADGNLTSLGYDQVSTVKKRDSEGRAYYLIRLPQKAQIKRIQIGLARYVASGTIDVSEVYFYYYDTIVDDIAGLYEDDLHLVLRPDVTQETIDALRTRLNTPDAVSGELNPDIELLEKELENAEDILNCKNLGAPVYIHNTISTNDVGRGFRGLNAWQPIGVTAAAGDTVTVYVGHNTKTKGLKTNLQLVATEYHSESGAMSKTVADLKVGSNVIDIPKLWSIDEESGGALYIQYTGSNANDRYAVRVSGGVKVPVLDLYGIETESEKLELAENYVKELEEYVGQMEQLHAQHHANSSNASVNKYEYNARNCILGASDILLDNMLLSMPAAQILAGAGQGTAADKAEQIVKSAQAMEDMLYLFYQHKGLNDNAENEIDRLPKQHLNIRYQRMFSKAFMYAAGNHIGIEWNECSGMVSASPLVYDEDGKYVSGHYFGWGIAHEIGHCINQSAYEVAEITNNYFAQLAQAKDTNVGMRFTYKNIYDKVTSGTTGQSSNIATQLGMYWQLHLAYDMSYNYKTFDDHSEQLESLFYARVDSYARTPSLAPAPGGIPLVLGGGTDQCLMRLACAAAEKDILEFFERWGKTPDSTTVEYASQFEKEERAIYYTDDNSRVYRIENPDGGYLGTNGDAAAVGAGTA
nr:fibronectin type III domain-containing protein [Oscillospiraceae bacterium]